MRATRRSLRRAWRVMTWPLSGDVALTRAIGFTCGMAVARYPTVISPPYPPSSARSSSAGQWSRWWGASLTPNEGGRTRRPLRYARSKSVRSKRVTGCLPPSAAPPGSIEAPP